MNHKIIAFIFITLLGCNEKKQIQPSELKAEKIALGSSFTCTDSELKGLECWGENSYGQLGNGTFRDSTTAIQSEFKGKVSKMKLGTFHGCLISEGEIFCWGRNTEGQVSGTNSEVTKIPKPIEFLTDNKFIDIAISTSQTCALSVEGKVLCWGNVDPELRKPKWITTLPINIKLIAGGENHFCATDKVEIYCWGENQHGQLGDGTQKSSLIPNKVKNIQGSISMLALGSRHSCVKINDELLCWGANDFGQIGDGSKKDQLTPVKVKLPKEKIDSISAGGAHTAAILNGDIWIWGSNAKGQCMPSKNTGNQDGFTLPTKLPYFSNVNEVFLGQLSTCIIKTNHYSCWGASSNGF